MKRFKRSIAIFLCVVMTLTAAPLSGFVGMEWPSLFNFEAEAATYSGECGDNVYWSLDTSTGVLNISGTGAMYDWGVYDSPWFSYNYSIKTINISNGVTTIGKDAFFDCSELTSITIPDSVITIGNYAFEFCSSLTSVTIPDSVTTIGDGALDNCYSLTSITVDVNNKYYSCDSYGVLFNKDKTKLIQYPAGNTRTSYTIPDSVIIIGNSAFDNCRKITNVTIPDSVTMIGDWAFVCCTSLTSVTIPDSVTTIGNYAFVSCYNLTSVTIGNSVTNIGESAFEDCDSLKDVYYTGTQAQWKKISIGSYNEPLTYATIHFAESEEPIVDSGTCGANLTWTLNQNTGVLNIIGTGAMNNYTSSLTAPWYSYRSYIKTVNIGNRVTTIGSFAFYNCDSLTSVTIGYNVTTIGSWAFCSCDSLISVTIPDSVTTIGNSAFSDCDNLTSVTIPNSVTTIDYAAFSDCDSLTSITVDANNKYYSSDSYGVLFNKNKTTLIQYPVGNARKSYIIPDSVTTIGGGAFEYCDSLTSVTIGNSVTTIGGSAFNSCSSLTSVTIPDSVTTIGDWAFAHCSSLTSVTIGNSVTTIGSSAFYGSDSLKSITVDTNNKYYSSDSYGVLFNKDKTRLIRYPIGNTRKSYTIPNSVTTIGNSAFYYCDSLTSVTIPDSVITIGDAAFFYCDSLTSVTIPDSVTTIGDDAFFYCDSLTDVYYTGTQAEWNKISIGSSNEDLTSATIHYNFSGFGNVVSENIDYYIKYDDHDYRRVTINATIADSSFSQDSAVYSHDLARLCSQFTVVGYTSGDGNGNGKNTVMKKALKELGFENPVVNLSEERTSVNYFITHKKITVNGEEYTLIFMGFIGSYQEQWYSNFDPGEGKTHQGFKGAATSMKLVLMDYIKDMNLDKSKTKFLITGHSRGAATANLFAADLIKNEQFALKENVYTYAFATPNSTSLPERNNAEYKRIFNIVNPEDFVTKVMPAQWDYGRYGTTYVLPSRTNTSNYSAYYSNMNPVFKVLTNGENYAPYKNGEEEVYNLVKKFTSTVKSPGDFYYKEMSYLPFKDITPWAFFQIAVCPLVGEKVGADSEFLDGLFQFVSCLLYVGACETYKEFCEFFLVNGVLDKVNNMIPEAAKAAITILRPLFGVSLNTALATSEGYFEDAHRAETYCAYMMSMTETQVKQTRKGYENTVNCPVDIEVIDKVTGEVVGRIVNNVVDEEIAAKENAIVMSVDGDSKSFWLPSDGDYEVKLIGNDEGTMDYTVAEIDPDLGETERVNFFDVEITEGKEFTGDVPAYDFELEEYTLKTDSSEEVPDQKLDAESGEITITTSVEGDGYVTESFNVKSGDYVTVSAQPFVTAKLVKWVDSSGNILSTDAEYSFVAKENTIIKAVFTTASGLNIQNPSTTTVNYGDILVLDAVCENLPEGYSIIWGCDSNAFAISYDEFGTCYAESVASGNATVKATLVDENGEAVLDADGNEIVDTIELVSRAGFFQRLISFFKNLFGLDRRKY